MAEKQLNLKPAPGYLLLEPEEAEGVTASGIVLPDTVSEKPQTGKVLEVGDNEVTDQGAKKVSPVKAGDKVIYKKWGGNEIKVGAKDYLFVKFEDILAIYS